MLDWWHQNCFGVEWHQISGETFISVKAAMFWSRLIAGEWPNIIFGRQTTKTASKKKKKKKKIICEERDEVQIQEERWRDKTSTESNSTLDWIYEGCEFWFVF